ncbi:MAG: four helix bundle protein [Prevotellaceae bacterium]|jgi:four helix bundle protein|nr:four helix bundle protein [Prevotellaceae bacterium]
MKESSNLVEEKSVVFGIRIVKACRYLQNHHREHVLSKQLLRSGTAIGALIKEGEFAESKADFIHKLSIALKEANETKYWLLLLYESKYFSDRSYASINDDCLEIIRLLVSIIKRMKDSNGNNTK